MAERDTPEAAAGARTPADVCTLLIDLSRVLKACRFYPPEHPARKQVVDRAWRAWRAELERGGSLELELRQGGFRLVGSKETIGRGSLDDLAGEFVRRAVRFVRFERGFDLDGFIALIDVIVTDPEELATSGGVERALYARVRGGITLNQVDYAALLDRPETPSGAAPPEAAVDAEAQAGTEGAAEQTTGVDPLAMLAGLLESRGEGEADAEAAPPESEERRSAELVVLLRDVDECREDAGYAQLLPRVVAEAVSLADEGHLDEGYRAIRILATHAADPERSERQRAVAEEGLLQVASGKRLDDLIRRACEPDPASSIRASQLLLQLGAHAVPRLLEELRDQTDPSRRGQIGGVLIAMGEKAGGHVVDALKDSDPDRARVAARLAGEMQNPGAVPALRGLLRSADVPPDLRKEAAKALVRIGNRAAIDTLIEALSSPHPEVPTAAAFCLGATGAPRALEALVGALRRALRGRDGPLAREVVRALGRLGRAEAAPELAGILRKRALLGRRRLRELQLAAAAALARVPGDSAREALERAALRGEAQVRRVARASLVRRSGEHPSP